MDATNKSAPIVASDRGARETLEDRAHDTPARNGCTAADARAYIALGWALVPAPLGSKAPNRKGWNSRARTWSRPEHVPAHYRANVGIAHAFCDPPTLALDVDNYIAAHAALAAEGIDLDAMMATPDAVQIRSGAEGRAKLLYRLPSGAAPIPSVDRTDAGAGYEIRCGTADGQTVQDMLPPSVHPNGNAYAWGGGGQFSRLPECPAALIDLARRLHGQPVSHVNGSAAHVSTPEGRHADMLKVAARVVATTKRCGGAVESAIALVRAERDRERWPGRHVGDDEIDRAVRGAWAKFDTPPDHPRVSDFVPKPVGPRVPAVNRLADVIDKEFAPVRYAIADLIPEGVVLLVGAPKIGKSWLIYQCAAAVAAGSAVWRGRAPELPGSVLMLALEDNDRRMVSRGRKIVVGRIGTERLHYATEWPRADKGGIEALDAWLAEHPDCRLVVIDTLARWRGEAKRSDSAYTHDYEVGAQLKPLSDRYHVAIVIVHHTRKAVSADVLDAASGTLGLTGSVDAALILRRERGAMDAALYVTGRDIEHELDHAMTFDAATCLWSSSGTVESAQISRERRDILDYLAANPLSRPKQIAEGVGKAQGAVRYLLHKMRAVGEVVEMGGLYTHPPTNAPNSDNATNTPNTPNASGDRGVSGVRTVSAVRAQRPPCPRCDGEGCPHCEVQQ